mgnify:FL=1
MFYHNFKYTLKVLLRNKGLLFWTFAFPILLGILFNMAFKDIENKEAFDVIDIAIVENAYFENDLVFKESFKTLSNDDSNKIFDVTYTDLENAKKLLEEEKITGYLTLTGTGVNITVTSSGTEETILRYVTEEIESEKEIIYSFLTSEKEEGNNNFAEEISKIMANTDAKINNISNKNLGYTMIEYYTLIAMAALYGGTISMNATNYKLANMNPVGKRTAISPVSKRKMILGSLLASYIVQLIGLSLLFIFTIFVMKVDYGNNLPLVILLGLIGSLAGLSLGIMISSLFKTNENNKDGILISITMLWCFLSGMMGITMKYVVDKYVPILNKINPASMMTDGLYALYYYETKERYFFDIISLLVFSFIMIIISYRSLRRQKYDSI